MEMFQNYFLVRCKRSYGDTDMVQQCKRSITGCQEQTENSPQDRITVHSSSISLQVAKEQACKIIFEVTNLNVYLDHYQCFVFPVW